MSATTKQLDGILRRANELEGTSYAYLSQVRGVIGLSSFQLQRGITGPQASAIIRDLDRRLEAKAAAAEAEARQPDGQTCRCPHTGSPHVHVTYPADLDARPEHAWDAALTDAIAAAVRAASRDLAAGSPEYVKGQADLILELMGLPPQFWRTRITAAITEAGHG